MDDKLEFIDINDYSPDCAGIVIGLAIDRLASERFYNENEEKSKLLHDAYQPCFIARRLYNQSQRIKTTGKK